MRTIGMLGCVGLTLLCACTAPARMTEEMALDVDVINTIGDAEVTMARDAAALNASIVAAGLQTTATDARYTEMTRLLGDLERLRQQAITVLRLPAGYVPTPIAISSATAVHLLDVHDGAPTATQTPADAAAAAEADLAALQQQLRNEQLRTVTTRRSIVGDDTKSLQSSTDEGSDAVSQQTNLASEILIQLSVLLSQIDK